ncbi:PH domain-containing protein [Marivirga sericea]|uniref:PH domain-containing protein n=2 Tax=Marivirga sericea TaxID=1028 RepID=A0A1X7K468_9BACT|nr:PH domain-containing protein [Marivirga sericea]
MHKKYPSKVSYGLLVFIFVIFFAPFIFDLLNNGLGQLVSLVLVVLLFLYGFILHMFFQTGYSVENGQLKIKMGFFSFRSININEIKKISKTSSILSAPAPSFDRIEIRHGDFGSIIISPKDKISFAKDLSELNPEINNNLI